MDVRARRTNRDFAGPIMELADLHHPEAGRITLLMDNLNPHRMGCLYEAFARDEARRIIERIEVSQTPLHGSWLKMVECGLTVLEQQCLANRIGDRATLRERVSACSSDRTTQRSKIDWPFHTAAASFKLRPLCPKFQMA